VQLGKGQIYPFQFLFFFWIFNNSIWSSLIPGISMGTSSWYRNAAAVLITGVVSANFGSMI
jgi:hypothetical protein